MAKLIVVEGPDRGTEFALPDETGASLTIGRDPKNPVVLNDASVSRQHLRIEFTGGDYRLVDLGSRNRTFLNSDPVREGLLRNGDRIGIGDTEMRFEDDRAPAEAGLESTIMKEVPAGRGGLQGILDAIAVSGNREEKLQDALGKVRKLLELSRAISRSASIDQLYRELLEILLPALEADRAVVLSRQGGRWIPRASHAKASEAEHLPVSESVIRRAADEAKAILSAHTRSDERFQDKASVVQAGIVSAIAAPMIGPAAEGEAGAGVASGKVLGVLYADRRGAERPFGDAELALLSAAAGEAGALAARLEEEARLRDENRNLLRSIAEWKKFIGRSQGAAAVLEFIRRAAPASQTILIRGDTGTGKELVASAIHYGSPRQGKPFIAINCAAIPPTLIESELFGHERGAFTGAVARRKGKFELAEGGTVFLDEVAELSPGCQAKLLRLLEDRKFERVGGAQVVEVDVRIIAATNKDLARAIASGEFREDLFYRLNVLGITLPTLRERREDIPLLAAHFLAEMGKGKWSFAPETMEKLMEYPWPGNIRQLRNVIESAVVFSDGPVIRASDIVLPSSDRYPGAGGPGPTWEPITLEELQRRHILKVLEYTGGNKKRAADLLGIERCTLYAKLRTLCNIGPARGETNGDDGNGEKNGKGTGDPLPKP
jgi:transcriptional regulator with GAF, ATPase, and Fis domain